jgi:hypothetical protein
MIIFKKIRSMGIFNRRNYFIGDTDSFIRLKQKLPGLTEYSTIKHITPVQIKKEIISYYKDKFNKKHTLYVEFPKIYNYKKFSSGSFANFEEEFNELSIEQQTKIGFVHNDYLIELYNYCAVFEKLKEQYEFKLINPNNVFDEKTYINEAYVEYYYYVKQVFESIIEKDVKI